MAAGSSVTVPVEVDFDVRRLVQIGPELIAVDQIAAVVNISRERSRVVLIAAGGSVDWVEIDLPVSKVAKILGVAYEAVPS